MVCGSPSGCSSKPGSMRSTLSGMLARIFFLLCMEDVTLNVPALGAILSALGQEHYQQTKLT